MSYEGVVGKTIERVEYDYDDALCLFFTDGSMLFVQGVWHNDSTSGTAVAMMAPEQPKSYAESKGFYDLVMAQEWPQS